MYSKAAIILDLQIEPKNYYLHYYISKNVAVDILVAITFWHQVVCVLIK